MSVLHDDAFDPDDGLELLDDLDDIDWITDVFDPDNILGLPDKLDDIDGLTKFWK